MSVLVDIEKQLGEFRLKVAFSGGEEVIALLGASGCGKSMTLKCIAGIERPDRGKIVVNGRTLFDSERHIDLSPQQRRTGLMFQNYALFPNMTVLQNIRAGAKRERDAEKRERLTLQTAESFGLLPLLKRYPHELSGGEQQRVALARMLVSGPDVILLDEPFSALDSHLRFRLEQEVGDILRDFGKTVILVSHDRDEVFRLSQKIAVMNAGKIEVFGEKQAVFAHPMTKTAAILTGCKNLSRAEKVGTRRIRALDWGVELDTARDVSDAVFVGIRMHDILAEPDGLPAEIVSVTENPFSDTVLVRLMPDAAPLAWETEKGNHPLGSQINLKIPPEKLLLLRS